MNAAVAEATENKTFGNRNKGENAVFAILLALSFCHLLNDMVTSLVPALYPVVKDSFHLSFTQVGLVTLAFQMTASLFQPVVGLYTDHRPKSYALAGGMTMTLCGITVLALASNFYMLLASAALVGMGSAIFHPEASRIARLASGGQHGLAQSLFQVGGSFGSSLGPLIVAFMVVPLGEPSVAWFSLAVLLAMVILTKVGSWYKRQRSLAQSRRAPQRKEIVSLSSRKIAMSMTILLVLVTSKYVYMSSLGNYYTFYLIDRFHLSVEHAQIYLFVFLAAVAGGTMIGGPIGDRVDRKYVIWGSILGVLPFSLALPYANLFWTGILTVLIGLILASAFSVIVVYAQELLPGKVGMVAGLFFGTAFGVAGIGAAVLGKVADWTSIEYVYRMCSYLPAMGLLTVFLPNLEKLSRR